MFANQIPWDGFTIRPAAAGRFGKPSYGARNDFVIVRSDRIHAVESSRDHMNAVTTNRSLHLPPFVPNTLRQREAPVFTATPRKAVEPAIVASSFHLHE